jgi:UDPglucose--hexose-1-phosphate uridylyltransferase
MTLKFQKQTVVARYEAPGGEAVERPVETRIHPITGRSCRIAFSRVYEKEAGTESFPPPPPAAANGDECPFCKPQIFKRTPKFASDFIKSGRLIRGDSILFPNLFPYGSYSAVSIFDNTHFAEIGTASPHAYGNSFLNCRDLLGRIIAKDPQCGFMAITQNHLPSAGGSLVHPHLQVHADRIPSNRHRSLAHRASDYFEKYGRYLLSDYLESELASGQRHIGNSGDWQWLSAFAPEGFFELWGILPGILSFKELSEGDWLDLSRGVINTQKFYRHLCRNGYNLGLLFIEDRQSRLEARVVIVARSNYAPWVRSDFTGYEVMLGDMATFVSPEETARLARPFWNPALQY